MLFIAIIKSMLDLISIIVPIYNVDLYVEKCLESISLQTYKNIEVLLINDGSTDNSKIICEKFANNDERFILFNQNNQGLSAARNKGLEIAKGKYVAFIDSDDFIAETFIEELYCMIKKYNVPLAEVNSIIYHEGHANFSYSKKSFVLPANKWLTQTNQRKFLSVVVWNKLYLKELFDGIKFPVGMKFEDEAVSYKLILKAGNIARSFSKSYAYRQRENSIMNSNFSLKDVLDKISIFEDKIKFLSFENDHICDFAIAKFLIYLFSVYNKYGEELDKIIIDKINRYYDRFKKMSKLPLKYQIYIKYHYHSLSRDILNNKV